MTYQDIHTFLTIASSSSLSKAAESLFVSQPALSHRLSALEEELGCPILTSPLTQYNGALGAALFAWQAATR